MKLHCWRCSKSGCVLLQAELFAPTNGTGSSACREHRGQSSADSLYFWKTRCSWSDYHCPTASSRHWHRCPYRRCDWEFLLSFGTWIGKQALFRWGASWFPHQSQLAGQLLAEQMRLQLQNEDLLVDDAIVAKLKRKKFFVYSWFRTKNNGDWKVSRNTASCRNRIFTAAHF